MQKQDYHINNSSNKRIEILHKISEFISLIKNIYLKSLVNSNYSNLKPNKSLSKAIALKKEILENISNENLEFKKSIRHLLKIDNKYFNNNSSKN